MRFLLSSLCGLLIACSATGEVMTVPYRDTQTPAGSTVVNRQLMDEQNATTLPEALKNVPGMTH